MKKLIICLSLLCSLLIDPIQTFAIPKQLDDINPSNPTVDSKGVTYQWQCGNPLISKEANEKIDDFKENDANMAEKFVASQVQNIFNIGDIAGLNTLIYGNPYCLWLDKEDSLSSDGIFTEKERSTIVEPMLKLFSASYVTLLVLAILIASLKMGLNAISPQSRAEFWNDVKMWLLSAIFMLAYIPLTNTLFGLNTVIVQSIRSLLGDNVDGVSIISNFKDMSLSFGVMPMIITFLGEWLLATILNFVYISRKVIILILLIMGPIAAYSMLFAKTRAFLGTWIKELVGNVFLQTIHAIVLFAFVMLSDLGAGVIMKLGLMMMFIPVSGMISRWLNIGDSSSKVGSMMSMVGLGGIMSTVMLAQQAGNIMRGGNMFSNNSNSSNGSSTLNSSSAESSLMSAGGGNDSGITSISSSAMGQNSSIWQNMKKGAGAVGAVIGGAAGAVTGNPVGVIAGAKAGSAISQGALQASRNVGYGFANSLKTLASPFTYNEQNGQGLKGFMGNLEARREFGGNVGESIGSMVGLGYLGRNVGHALSGVSRNRLANAPQSQGGLAIQGVNGSYTSPSQGRLAESNPSAQALHLQTNKGSVIQGVNGSYVTPSLKRFAESNPGAQALHLQTNKGSAIMMKNRDGEWTKIGLTGQADPTLKNSSVRATPFQFSNSKMGNLELQPNGSYKQQQLKLDDSGNPRSQNVTAGLPGSTPHLMRTGNSYIVGGGSKDGKINLQTAQAAMTNTRVEDQNFDSSRINPDAYFINTSVGKKANSVSDHVADTLHLSSQTVKSASSWVTSKVKKDKGRRREIV